MRVRGFLLLLWLMVANAGLTAAGPAWARSLEGARAFVDDFTSRAVAVLREDDITIEERELRLAELLAEYLDLPYVARLVLGRPYRGLDDQAREDYSSAFSDYVLKVYSRRLTDYSGDELVVLGANPSGKRDVIVTSELRREEGSPIEVGWRVRERSGAPRVIDLSIEGVSMAVTYRNEFAAVVEKVGIDGLIELLRARAERAGVEAGV